MGAWTSEQKSAGSLSSGVEQRLRGSSSGIYIVAGRADVAEFVLHDVTEPARLITLCWSVAKLGEGLWGDETQGWWARRWKEARDSLKLKGMDWKRWKLIDVKWWKLMLNSVKSHGRGNWILWMREVGYLWIDGYWYRRCGHAHTHTHTRPRSCFHSGCIRSPRFSCSVTWTEHRDQSQSVSQSSPQSSTWSIFPLVRYHCNRLILILWHNVCLLLTRGNCCEVN